MIKKIVDDSVIGWNAAAFSFSLTDLDLIIKIAVGLAVFVYTSIKIKKELHDNEPTNDR